MLDESETTKTVDDKARDVANCAMQAQREIEKLNRVLEKLTLKDEEWLSDEEVVEVVAEEYRRQHPGQFPQNPDGSFPPTPIQAKAAKASEAAKIRLRVEKLQRLIEKLRRLQNNPKDAELFSDEEVLQAVAEEYRRQHPGQFPQNPDGSFPPTPIEVAVRNYREARRALKSSILEGFALTDDIESGCYDKRRKIAELAALMPLWSTLTPEVKSSIPNRIHNLSITETHSRDRTVEKEFKRQLERIEQQWKERSKEDAVASFGRLCEQVANITSLSTDGQRDVLKTARRLRRKERWVLEREERDQLAGFIREIRDRLGVRWWQFWL